LTVDEQVRDLVLKKSDSATIKNAACRAGMVALREAGLAKALAGQTTLEEVMRVTQEEG
jgi:general secretion pathway protein E